MCTSIYTWTPSLMVLDIFLGYRLTAQTAFFYSFLFSPPISSSHLSYSWENQKYFCFLMSSDSACVHCEKWKDFFAHFRFNIFSSSVAKRGYLFILFFSIRPSAILLNVFSYWWCQCIVPRNHHKHSHAALISLLKSINFYFQYQWTNNRPVDISALIFMLLACRWCRAEALSFFYCPHSVPISFFPSTHVELYDEWQTMCNLFRIGWARLCLCAPKVSTTLAVRFVFLLILFFLFVFPTRVAIERHTLIVTNKKTFRMTSMSDAADDAYCSCQFCFSIVFSLPCSNAAL